MRYILVSAIALMALCFSSCKDNREEQIRKEVEMRVAQEKKLMKAEAEIEAAKAEAARAKVEAQVAQAAAQVAQATAEQAKAKAAAKSAQQASDNNSTNSPYGTLVMVKREGGYTNIRSGCGSSCSIVEKVRDGSYIKVGDRYGQWYEVYDAYGGVKGYIHASKIVF